VKAFADGRDGGGFDRGDFVGPALYLATAGLVLGLIATLRVSPLGAGVTGLLYSTTYVAMLVDPAGLLELFPNTVGFAGRRVDPTIPLRTGTAMLLGVLLLLAIVSVSRWRRRTNRASEPDWVDDYTPPLPVG
jgi:hypothetical protein